MGARKIRGLPAQLEGVRRRFERCGAISKMPRLRSLRRNASLS